MVLTCVSTAGRGGGEGSPGRDEEEQEAQKDRHCRIGPVAFPERENTHRYKKVQKKKKKRETFMFNVNCCYGADSMCMLSVCVTVCVRVFLTDKPHYLPTATHTCLITRRLLVVTTTAISVVRRNIMGTHFSKRDVQPGTKPGSLVNHSRVIRTKKTPVTTSG